MSATVAAKHSCLAYDDRADLESCARAYLGAGLAAGERVLYAAPGGPGGLTGWLADAAVTDPDSVLFVALETAYPAGTQLDPQAQVAAYAGATEAALSAGYAGLRVVADVTPLVSTPAGLAAFARYEALVDSYIAGAPMRAICAVDRGAAGDRPVAELACLHPAANVDGVRFTLRSGPPGGPAAVLAGELDIAADRLFPVALAHVRPRAAGGRIVIDAAGLRFADHRALLHLHRYGEAAGAIVVLRTPLPAVARLAELVGLARVRVEGPR
ncbi:MEDS domain-containing protein [Dactylosporangium salmoneum]|uniref:MEDS domain-containing protein n=1 Tax=Dactylosporangium salmoneum TaxID=53361 RepID=UPI0031D06884